MWGWVRGFGRKATTTAGTGRDLVLSLVPSFLQNLRWFIGNGYLALAEAGYGKNGVAYGCIRLLAQSLPEPPIRALQVARDGTREALPADHPLAVLLARPNELMTQFEMIELIATHVGIGGASYWWKQRTNGGQVDQLWPLRPDRVAPIYSQSSQPGERLLWGWAYQAPGEAEPVRIPRSEVFAVNLPDPSGESGGVVEALGPLQVLAREVSADNEATGWVGSLLANGAQPLWALKLKGRVPDEKTAKQLKANFRAEFGGTKRGEVAVVDADTEIEKLSFTMKDLEFPDLRNISESRIAAAFGTPAILVGLKVGLDRSTFANMSEAREFFAETTLSVWWRRLADQFTVDLCREFGDDLVAEFDTSNVRALAGQRTQAITPLKDGYAAGVVTVNEYRAALRLPAIDNGDVFVRPLNVVEVLAEAEAVIKSAKALKAAPRLTAREANRLADALGADTRDKNHAAMEQRITAAAGAYGQDGDAAAFRAAMSGIVAAGAINGYRIAAGRGITPADLPRLTKLIADQEGYLDGFMTDLAEYQPGETKGVISSFSGVLNRALAYVVAAVQGAAFGRMADKADEEKITWVTQGDDRVSDTCQEMAGEHTVAALNEGGIFPGIGVDCASNCRCELE